MSDKDELERVLSKIAKAEAKVSKLCSGDEKWMMSIPARPDHDPDIVISDALREAKAALSASTPNTHVRGLVEALREIQTLCITESHKFMGGSGQKIAEIHVTVNEALAALPAGWKGE